MRFWWLLAAAALLWAVPSGSAGMGDAYDLDLTFVGYGCVPTAEETSVATSPRADIMGIERIGAGPLQYPWADSVVHHNLTGFANNKDDPAAALGDPRLTVRPNPLEPNARANFDRAKVASLGKAGYLVLGLREPVTDGAGNDLIVWEAAYSENDPNRRAFAEPFCVYGAPDLGTDGKFTAGDAFYYVGLWNPDPLGGPEDARFDLGTYYSRFSGATQLKFILVMDSGQAGLLIEPVFKILEAPPYPTKAALTFRDTTHPSIQAEVTAGTWSFGDGTTAPWVKGVDVAHTYARNGTYRACLELRADDVQGTSCRDVDVNNRLPLLEATAQPAQAPRNTEIALRADASDPEGTALSIEWFHAGAAQPFATGATASTSFATLQPATRDVRVVAKDADGGVSQKTLTITMVDRPPVADFTIAAHPGATGIPIQFTSTSSDPDGDTLTYAWDFDGDGRTDATERQPTFTYLHARSQPYPVTLTVKALGLEATMTRPVVIDNWGPQAKIEGPDEAFTGQVLTFHDRSTDVDGNIAARHWTFGTQGSSAAASPMFTFARAGTYDVQLRVIDDRGAWADAVHRVIINNRPPDVTVKILEQPNTTRIPFAFDFTATDSDGRITAWSWDFGDGAQSTDPRPRHAYQALGTYSVTLRVHDDDGDVGTAMVTVHVTNQAPWPDMGRWRDDGTPPGTVRFQDLSRDPDGAIVARAWDFGDGSTSSATEVVHRFADPQGTYRVTLTVQDDDGAVVALTQLLRPSGLGVPGDGDADGIPDTRDNCPSAANVDQRDSDGDGIGDACDGDADGDGHDLDDAFPDDPTEWQDTDGDGIGDNADPDDDNDGILDVTEHALGTDPRNADSDGDGVPDGQELTGGWDPLDPNSPVRTPRSLQITSTPVTVTWRAAEDPRIDAYRVWRLDDGRALVAEVAAGPDVFSINDPAGGSHYEVEALAGGEVLGADDAALRPAAKESWRIPAWPFWTLGALAVLAGAGFGVRAWLRRPDEIQWRSP